MATGYDFQSTSGSSKKRTRNPTAKGREFQRQLYEDQRSSAQRGWRRQINNIENCLADSTDPNKLQSERNFLESKMDILVSAQERFLDTLEDSQAKRVAEDKFEMWEREHSDSLRRVNSKITELKNENPKLIIFSDSFFRPQKQSFTSQYEVTFEQQNIAFISYN